MSSKVDLEKGVDDFFTGTYDVSSGTVIPNVADIPLGKSGRELDLTMMFIDIRESTKIVDSFRRVTAAKMYKSFLWGVAKVARDNHGELRSFNGDGVLMAFIGPQKRNNAVKAAMQMKSFCVNILRPKLQTYFQNNSELADMEFNFGIGIDSGKVLVVRGGIKGENNNDLVWVGNPTNYAVKLSNRSVDDYHIYISEEVYSVLDDTHKFGGSSKKDMWEPRTWNDMTIYRTSWSWKLD